MKRLRTLLGEDNQQFAAAFVRAHPELEIEQSSSPEYTVYIAEFYHDDPHYFYQLIISDLSYTDEHKREGYEVIRQIRTFDKKVPIILQTGADARDMPEIERLARAAGANYVFSKQDSNGINAAIGEVVRRKRR